MNPYVMAYIANDFKDNPTNSEKCNNSFYKKCFFYTIGFLGGIILASIIIVAIL
jgi:hypothetical protein